MGGYSYTMPIYEFKCENEECEEVTEKMRKLSEREDPYECPRCGAKARRMVSGGSFQLKGGGWAETGYS